MTNDPVHVQTPESLYQLAKSLKKLHRAEEAMAAYRQAIALRPSYAEAHNNLGNLLHGAGRLDEAMDEFRRALRYRPDLVEIYVNIGHVLKDTGQVHEAIAAYRQAMAIKPNWPTWDHLLMILNYAPDLGPEQILQQHLRWGEACTAFARSEQAASSEPRGRHAAGHRLRIGYVSPNFSRHVVGFNLLPLIERHDRSSHEIFLYSNVLRPDELTDRFRATCDHYHDITAMTDAQVAALVRRDRIDVLVDLALHTVGNRLPVFARKAAPVQVTWAGYPGTTGLRQIDYRLTDPYLDPPGQMDAFYVEQSWRLPDSFWCYKPYSEPPDVSSLPALANGHITFGCPNGFCKVNPAVIELWSRVLCELPSSRMLLLSPPGAHRDRTLELFRAHGVDSARIEFVGIQSIDRYLRTFHRIDIGLDTFPYNGHTTTIESMWMGVPVVTLMGRTVVGRAGWCQLNNIALSELAAHEPAQFVRLAAALANNLPRLGELRAGLRRRMENSPLMDFDRFTGNLEAAFRQMWIRCPDGPSVD